MLYSPRVSMRILVYPATPCRFEIRSIRRGRVAQKFDLVSQLPSGSPVPGSSYRLGRARRNEWFQREVFQPLWRGLGQHCPVNHTRNAGGNPRDQQNAGRSHVEERQDSAVCGLGWCHLRWLVWNPPAAMASSGGRRRDRALLRAVCRVSLPKLALRHVEIVGIKFVVSGRVVAKRLQFLEFVDELPVSDGPLEPHERVIVTLLQCQCRCCERANTCGNNAIVAMQLATA